MTSLPLSRFLPLVFITAGVVCLGSVILPLGFSFTRYYLFRPPSLIDPLAVGAPGPRIVNIFGVAAPDYDSASSWFVSPPVSAPVSSPVKYFTVSYPRLKLFDVPVEVNGTDLAENAVHYPGTALPGTPGNAVIIGHSALPQFYQSGNPLTIFNPLPGARVGDDIYVNFDGVNYHYLVHKTSEVDPTAVQVFAQHYDRTEITLITCVPLGTYWHRFIVLAELSD